DRPGGGAAGAGECADVGEDVPGVPERLLDVGVERWERAGAALGGSGVLVDLHGVRACDRPAPLGACVLEGALPLPRLGGLCEEGVAEAGERVVDAGVAPGAV